MKPSASIAATLLLCGVVAYAEDAAQCFPQSAGIPRNVTELWAGYAEFDKASPLDVEVLKAWENDGVVCRLIRYQVGVFKGAPAKVAAFYAFPKIPEKLGMTGLQFLEAAIERNLILVNGGTFSQRDTHFRLSYAVPVHKLEAGLEVLTKLLSGA